MKILHVIESLDAGGAERVLLNIIVLNKDPEISHEIVCLSKEGELKNEFKKHHIKIHCLNKAKGFDLSVLWRVKKILTKTQPQLIHTHLFSGNLWGRLIALLYGIPCVMSVQNADSWISGWRSLAEKFLVDVPLLTIAASQTALEYRFRYGLKLSKSCVINNGVSAKAKPEMRQSIREKWGLKEDDKVIGVLARCVPQKDPELFLKIAKKLIEKNNKLYFIWAGGGSQLSKYQNCHEKIKFLGHQEDPMAVLSGFDILISTSRREGFSLSLIEGMWAGLPILVTTVPGNVEMFEAINPNLLIKTNLAEDFEIQLQEWLDNHDRAHEVGKQLALGVGNFFSAEGMAEKYQQIYKGLSI